MATLKVKPKGNDRERVLTQSVLAAAEGLQLAGVSSGVGGSAAVNAFYEGAGDAIEGSGAVRADYGNNAENVLYNEARSNSELPGQQWAMKTDEINSRNADQTVKDATDARLQRIRGDIDEDANSARERNDDWRNANIPGAADDWIPGLGN